MGFIRRFLLVLAASALLGTATAPFIYNLCLDIGWFHFVFEKVLNRCVLAWLILLLILFRKQLFTLSLEQLGMKRTPGWKRDLLYGIFFGTLSLAILYAIFYCLDVRILENRMFTETYVRKTIEYAFSALFIGVFEEILFRGFVFQGFLQTQKKWVAVVLSSLFYAVTHFLKPESFVVEGKVSLVFSFKAMFRFLDPLKHLDSILPEFLGLFLLGVVLAYAVLKTGRLYFSIALHGIWVYWIKIDAGFIRPTYLAGEHWFFGDGKVINGFVGWIFLCTALLWIHYFVPIRKERGALI